MLLASSATAAAPANALPSPLPLSSAKPKPAACVVSGVVKTTKLKNIFFMSVKSLRVTYLFKYCFISTTYSIYL